MTTFLFWDIDGTLLTTARAGIFAWEDATQEVLGRRLEMAGMQTAGLTDAEIAVVLVQHQGEADAAAAGRLLDEYARRLPAALPRREGQVLPNVRENLEALSARDDVVNMLLTGNVAAGAEAKLRHYGLWEFFGAGGAFSVEGSDRQSIARQARELAAEHSRDGAWPDGKRMVVIGDTPHDVACGKAIGARTVAVATGPAYSIEELRASEPWVALEAMPEPRAVQRLLGIDGSG
jgi:phosphoglycolate phosphatase-like HAD superfamily hydrolase